MGSLVDELVNKSLQYVPRGWRVGGGVGGVDKRGSRGAFILRKVCYDIKFVFCVTFILRARLSFFAECGTFFRTCYCTVHEWEVLSTSL